jgi:hypothetical protein
MANGESVSALASVLTQLFPRVDRVFKGLQFLVDQPVIREPYWLGTLGGTVGGQIVAAGATNVPLVQSDFSHALEWPFEVNRIRFSNDPQHTFRDWQVVINDLTFSQQWMKGPILVDNLIEANTGFLELEVPWIIRPQGGGFQIYVNNLDANNPINVSIVLHGSLLIPR